MALETSCRSTLLTMSKEFSAITNKCNKACAIAEMPASGSARLRVRGAEVSVEVRSGLAANFLWGNASKFTYLMSDLGEESRFIALAAVGNRREIRRISLDKDPVQRRHRGGVANVLRFRVSNVA